MLSSAPSLFSSVDRNNETGHQRRKNVASVYVVPSGFQRQDCTVKLQVQTGWDVITADFEIRVATLSGDRNVPDLFRNAFFLGSGH